MAFGRRSASALFAACVFSWGCETPGAEPFGPEEVAARTEIARAPGRTRSELRERLGSPWAASDRWRVDVFRLSGEQRVWVVTPLPMPSSREEVAFTLVSYDATGRVEAADSALPKSGLFGSVALEAGDYQFVTASERLSVSLSRFRSDQRARAGECTLLVACDTRHPARRSFPDHAARDEAEEVSPPVCWGELSVDGASGFPLGRPSVETADRAKEDRLGARENASATDRGDVTCIGESCTVRHNFFVPVPLPAGDHSLRFSKPTSLEDALQPLEGSLDARLTCEDGEVVFATVVGERSERYSAGKRLAHQFKWGAATGRVEISREPPPQLPRHTVLLFSAGEWLLPRDAAAR